ncbi:MAG: hypothetical protein AB1295_02695 [Candidatus Micrarchaeota archaeon]
MRLRRMTAKRDLPPWKKDPLGEAQRLRDCIIDGSIEERVRAIKGVQKLLHENAIDGERAKRILVRALSDHQLPVRFHAIKAMLADRGTVSGVLIALNTGSIEVKRMALRLLNGELERDQGLWKTDNLTDEEVHEACTVLVRALIDRDDTVCHEACEALCKLAERSPVHVMERLSMFRRPQSEGQFQDPALQARIAKVEQTMHRAMELSRVKG